MSACRSASDGRLSRAPAPSIFHGRPVSEPTEPQPVRYERVSVVEPGDIDDLGHVNNVVYLRWVQDVAAAHWEATIAPRSEEHTSELQSQSNLVCRLLLEKKMITHQCLIP